MENAHSRQYYEQLARKRLEGTITPAEAEELARWLNQYDEQPLEVPADFADSRSRQEERLLRSIEAETARVVPARRRLWRAASAAAVLLLVLAAGYILFKGPSRKVTAVKENLANDRPPAGNKAVLTLSNGQQVVLDSVANGLLYNQGGAQIVKLDSGRLAYNAAGQEGMPGINTLATPRGGQFRVILPDGSEVWLNAASRLKYPTAFSGPERVVELEGQAYFEIAPNSARPFRVKAGGTEVEVLGTRFDLMAYPDEGTINTTLVEGRVQVRKGDQVKMLQPRQQAVTGTRQGGITVRQADLGRVLAWKNGLFIFNNADFNTILREISRWYDIEIINQAENSNELYGGSISRDKHLSDVLKLLSAYGHHRFKTEGGKVYVLP